MNSLPALPELRTDRLVLRALSAQDADDLYLVYSHPDAMRFWGFPHRDVAETRTHIEEGLASPGRVWVLQLRTAPRVIGQIDLFVAGAVPGMGYILHPDFWHQGYMTEAMRAALDYAFDELGLSRVELWIASDNRASRRLAMRLGFTRRGALQQKYPHQAMAHEKGVYGLSAAEWRQEPPAPGGVEFYSMVPVLAVHDVRATAEYYRDVLGFTIGFLNGDPPSHGGVARVSWSPQGARIQLTRVEPEVELRSSVSFYVNAGPDLDALYNSFRERGADIVSGVQAYPWGTREFSIRDCNGYVLRFGVPA
jgi:[ribosomal protein S5]-alanine N-acetyltransferase